MKKIAVIAPSWIGDTIMMQPLLATLKAADSTTHITVIASPVCAPLLTRMPAVDTIIMNPFAHGALQLKARWHFGAQLRHQGFDQIIVLPNTLKSAFIAFATGIKKRTGYLGEHRYGLLNDIRANLAKGMARLVDAYGALAMSPAPNKTTPFLPTMPDPVLKSTNEQQHATRQKHQLTITNQPVLVLCTGAEYGLAKRWPPEHFAKVGQFALQAGYQLWLLGSPKDHANSEEIRLKILDTQAGNPESGVRNLCGQTTLDEAIDLIAAADWVISNDSGLMHAAAALQRPQIALYGSSSPEYTPPLNPKAHILSENLACSPCFQRTCRFGHYDCLQGLSPRKVIAILHTKHHT